MVGSVLYPEIVIPIGYQRVLHSEMVGSVLYPKMVGFYGIPIVYALVHEMVGFVNMKIYIQKSSAIVYALNQFPKFSKKFPKKIVAILESCHFGHGGWTNSNTVANLESCRFGLFNLDRTT